MPTRKPVNAVLHYRFSYKCSWLSLNTFSKFALVLTVIVLLAGQVGCSETDDLTLSALGCQFFIPNGYDLTPDEKGNIHSMVAGADSTQYPAIQYYPNEPFEDSEFREITSLDILSEKQIGHLRFLKVKFFVGAYEHTWDVFVSDSAFFASDAMHGTEFPDYFRTCAEKIANKSLNTDTGDAGVG